ncbi:MAG: response regulator [Nitrospinae bacterium]|nr:response regulator [Nitrospinota bacterium]
MLTIAEKKKLSVLVVDDFPNMRRTIKNMLHSLGYFKITEAGDGDEAIETLDRMYNSPSRVQFVVLDWNMPRVHGIDVLKFIKNDPRFMLFTSVLMVTAENYAEEIIEAAEDNVDGYIIKPFVAKTLEDKIAKILEKKNNPTKMEKMFREGIVLANKREYATAKAKFEELLAANPNSPRALRELGKICTVEENFPKAEECFRKALEINKDYTKAMENLATLYVKMGKEDEAIKVLEGAVKISPRNGDRLLFIGSLYMKKGKYREIIELYEAAHRLGLSMIRYDLDVILAAANLELKEVARAREIMQNAVGNAVDKEKVKGELTKALDASTISEPDKQELRTTLASL